MCIVVGSGNNGGDGSVAARHLLAYGARVRVHCLCDPGRLTGDARAAFESLRQCVERAAGGLWPESSGSSRGSGGSAGAIIIQPSHDELRRDLKWAHVTVDALLGTGFSRTVHGPAAEAISLINEHSRTVVAVDVPSGLDAATGKAPGACVNADVTVTFGHAKLGLLVHDGPRHAGRIVVDHIGMPAPLLAFGALNGAALEMLDPERVQAALPPRTPQMHKGEAGRVLVVAGSPPMPGAAALCAMASLRSGAGLAYLASYPEVARAAAARYSEIVMVPPGETLERAASADCVVAGPGMGNSARTREMIRLLLEEGIGATLVLDADALNCLEGRAHLLAAAARRGARLVLTPHPGELARLMGCSVREIQSDRVSWAVSAAGATGAVVILKGARTLVAAPDGRLAVNPTGNSGMATAGSGDVLAGVVAAMCASRSPAPFDAACAAAFCHGLAGDIAAERRGERGITAGDVLECLPDAFAEVEGHPAALWKSMPCVPMSEFERW